MAYRVEDLTPGQVLLMTIPATEPIWDRALDAAIAWSSGPFVHAALVGHGELIEQLSTVQTSPLDTYCENGWAYTVAGATPAQADATVAWALAHRGQPYGIDAILQDGLMYDVHQWRPLHDDPRYVTCSGFVERAWRVGAGIRITDQPLPSPTSLAFSPILGGPRPWDRTTSP